MSRLRVRMTIDRAIWNSSREYAKATHRSPAELYEEAVEQMMARYPKRPRSDASDLDALADRVAQILASRVPAGTSGDDSGEA